MTGPSPTQLHCNQFSVGSASEEYPLTVREFIGEGVDEFNLHYCTNICINNQLPVVSGSVLFTEMMMY